MRGEFGGEQVVGASWGAVAGGEEDEGEGFGFIGGGSAEGCGEVGKEVYGDGDSGEEILGCGCEGGCHVVDILGYRTGGV